MVPDNIDEGIKGSLRVVAVLSRKYLDSEYAGLEWNIAVAEDPRGKRRKLISLRVEDFEMEGIFKAIPYSDLFGLSEDSARSALLNAVTQESEQAASEGIPSRPRPRLELRSKVSCEAFPGRAEVSLEEKTHPPADTGELIAKCCDRWFQEEAFEDAFTNSVRGNRFPRYPQLYVIPGRVRESHEGLVYRFRGTLIQDFADVISDTKAKIGDWKVEWSYKTDVTAATHQLIERLVLKAHNDEPGFRFKESDYSETTFLKSIRPARNPVIVIQHEIDAARWTNVTEQTIHAYLEFWDKVGKNAEIPQFIIFLNVVYPFAQSVRWKIWQRVIEWRDKKRASSDLSGILSLNGRQHSSKREGVFCFYTLLDELPCVRFAHVVELFREYNLAPTLAECERQTENIFRLHNWKLDSCRNMADVEDALGQFLYVTY